ncbi:MAG: hypothetical protein QNJ19_14160 [Woeseiaceae bacterium]|nr:hypothetical protein [Woeseiaceae bacterium]
MPAFNEQALEKALNAIFKGPEKKKVRIKKHEFNFKKIETREVNGRLFVNGNDGHHISHHLTFRPDDQIFYEFEVTETGQIENVEVKISKGSDKLVKWVKQAGEAIALITTLLGASGVKSDDAADLVSEVASGKAEGLLDGSWRGEAMFVIANVMLLLAAEQIKKVKPQATRRRPRPRFAVAAIR